jgi:hypothetical protein
MAVEKLCRSALRTKHVQEIQQQQMGRTPLITRRGSPYSLISFQEEKMKKLTYLALSIALASGLSFARPKPAGPSGAKVFVGEISDSMCGLKHMMPNAKQCTLGCVAKGAKFVLADEKQHKVYNLSDQEKPKKFAGEKVRVKGTLSGDTINVASITPAH